MDDLPIGPTRRYVIVCHDGRRIDVDAESMWPAGLCLEFLGHPGRHRPREVCVQRIASIEYCSAGPSPRVSPGRGAGGA